MAILKPGQLASGSYTISGSFSGSFQGSGAGLNNIPSSAIVGLSSTQIASGAVTASVSTGTGSFTVNSGSSTFMFISSSGNVGIGTTTPIYKLHNTGTTGLSQVFGTSPSLYVYNGRTSFDSTLKLENQSGDLLYFGGSGLLVTGNTTIGNGSTTLSARLGVKGSGTTSSTTAFLIQNSAGTNSLQILDNGTLRTNSIANLDGTGLVKIPQYLVAQADPFVFKNTGNVDMLYMSTTVSSFQTPISVGLGFGVSPSARAHIRGTGTTSATTTLLVQNSNASASLAVLDNGNIGIGTISPSSSLHLYNSANVDVVATIESINLRSPYLLINHPSRRYRVGANISVASAFEIYDENAAANRLVIQTNGNVGIGTTTNAGYKLDVNGTARVLTGFVAGQAYGTFAAGFDTNWGYTITGGETAVITAANIQSYSQTIYGVSVPPTSANLILGTSYGYDVGQSYNIISTADLGIIVNRFTNSTKFFKNGNVVIGTTTDTGHKLTVSGSGTSGSLNIDNTLYVSGSRVGVGTSTPTRRIDVLGSGDVLTGLKTTSATGAASHVVLNDVDSSFEFGMWGSTRTSYGAIFPNNAYIYGGVDFAITSLSNIKFGAGPSVPERMRIMGGTGNVLIGTTTDAGYKLDVNGTARTQSPITLQNPGASEYFILSPSGSQFLYSYKPSVFAGYIMTIDGSTITFPYAVGFTGGLTAGNLIYAPNYAVDNSNANRYIRFWKSGVASRASITHTTAGTLQFRMFDSYDDVTGGVGMYIDQTGNVGITGSLSVGSTGGWWRDQRVSITNPSSYYGDMLGFTLPYSFDPGVMYQTEQGGTNWNGQIASGSNLITSSPTSPNYNSNYTNYISVGDYVRDYNSNFRAKVIAVSATTMSLDRNIAISYTGSNYSFWPRAYGHSFGTMVYNTTTNKINYWTSSSLNILLDSSGSQSITGSLFISGSSNTTLFEIDSPAVNNILFVSGSGNVGIGTGTPAYPLDVRGNAMIQKTSNATLYINETGGNTGDVANLYLIGNNMGWGASLRFNVGAGGANNRLDFYTATSRRMSIAADTGNILINTTTDAGFRLDVNGTVRSQGNLFFGTAGSYLLGDTNNIRLIDKNGQTILQSFPSGVNNSETYLRCANSTISFLRLRDDYMSLEWANSTISSTAQNPIQITRGYFGNVGATDKSVMYVKSTAFSNLSNATTLRGIFIDINDTTTYTGFTTVRAIEAPRGGAYFNTTSPQASAVLQADSTTQGFLPPRMTGAQAEAISSPAEGLMVYATSGTGVTITSKGWWGYDGATWVKLN